jgi:hypothetical protein
LWRIGVEANTHFVPDSSSAGWCGLTAIGSLARTYVSHMIDMHVDFADVDEEPLSLGRP